MLEFKLIVLALIVVLLEVFYSSFQANNPMAHLTVVSRVVMEVMALGMSLP
jgi:hypothetical protein